MLFFQIVFSPPLTCCLESSPHREVDEKVDATVHLHDKDFTHMEDNKMTGGTPEVRSDKI